MNRCLDSGFLCRERIGQVKLSFGYASAVVLFEAVKAYIKGLLVTVLAHPSRPLRQTAGSIASVVVGAGGLVAWPQLVDALALLLQPTGDEASVDGGISTLYKIIEDQPTQLEYALPPGAGGAVAGGGAATVNTSTIVVPLLLKLMPSPSADVRSKTVAALNLLAREMPTALLDLLDTYLQGLFALAHDASAGVRREVVTGLVQLVSIQPDRLAPFLYQVRWISGISTRVWHAFYC